MLLKITPIQPGMSAEKKLPKFFFWSILNWGTYCDSYISMKHACIGYYTQKNDNWSVKTIWLLFQTLQARDKTENSVFFSAIAQ